jgi:hypothetical protein
VENAIIAGVDGHVIYSPSLAREEHQVAGLERGNASWQRAPGAGLLPGGTRQLDAVPPKDVLHESGAVEADPRGFAAIEVALTHIGVPGGEHPSRAGGRGLSGPPRLGMPDAR